jgi:hypothetical protein
MVTDRLGEHYSVFPTIPFISKAPIPEEFPTFNIE